MAPETDDDRPRGILTPSDRAFLRGDSDLEEASARQKWYRIGRRVRESIRDFSLLVEALSSDRLRKMLYPDDKDEFGAVSEGVCDALALFFLRGYERPTEGDPPEGIRWNLNLDEDVHQNMLVKEGLSRALKQRGKSLHEYENFEYLTTPRDLDGLMREFRNGDPLTLDEFETLQREATNVDLSEWAKVVHLAAWLDNTSTSSDGEELIASDQHYDWVSASDDDSYPDHKGLPDSLAPHRSSDDSDGPTDEESDNEESDG
jgi:hypothetical protein